MTLAIVFWASQSGKFTICVDELFIDAYPGETVCLSRDVGLEYRNSRGTILINNRGDGPAITLVGPNGKERIITAAGNSDPGIRETSLPADHLPIRRK